MGGNSGGTGPGSRRATADDTRPTIAGQAFADNLRKTAGKRRDGADRAQGTAMNTARIAGLVRKSRAKNFGVGGRKSDR